MDKIINCSFCRMEISENAVVCRHCNERVTGKQCEDCRSLCPEDAKVCRWCGYHFSEMVQELGIEEFIIKAKSIPTFFIRGRLLSQRIRFNSEKVVVSTPGFFYLWKNETEVPWNKVAGFDYRSGIFWDAVEIETRGQNPTSIKCLSKHDGEKIRDILRRLEI